MKGYRAQHSIKTNTFSGEGYIDGASEIYYLGQRPFQKQLRFFPTVSYQSSKYLAIRIC